MKLMPRDQAFQALEFLSTPMRPYRITGQVIIGMNTDPIDTVTMLWSAAARRRKVWPHQPPDRLAPLAAGNGCGASRLGRSRHCADKTLRVPYKKVIDMTATLHIPKPHTLACVLHILSSQLLSTMLLARSRSYDTRFLPCSA